MILVLAEAEKNIRSAAERPDRMHATQRQKLPVFLACVLALGTFFWFSFSNLAFSPVPWPDGSAFYLPSIDLLSWPPQWKMHSQAAFVPSYDVANFNMMPLLPFLLGLFSRLGLGGLLGTPLAIKFISLAALILWAGLLWRWLWQASKSLFFATTLGLAALWDPVIRWGTLVVRSEIWIGLLWILILQELWHYKNPRANRAKADSRSLWKIALLLALGAYIHFEAIILVPATAVGLYRHSNGVREWWRSLIRVGFRTLAFLAPWGLYVLSHFSLFLDQMQTQFFRLAGSNRWIANPYLLFHSLFLELGSPIGAPKFFNVGKALFWLILISLTALSMDKIPQWIARKPYRKGDGSSGLELFLASGLLFWTSFYLWCTKPEVWFITLCHVMLWPWLGMGLIYLESKSKRTLFAVSTEDSFKTKTRKRAWTQKLLIYCASGYAILSLGANLGIQKKMNSDYTWPVYHQWVDCIERAVASAKTKDNPKVWQPHIPDVLVELSARRPEWDLTRTLDFVTLRNQAIRYAQGADAIIMSQFFHRLTREQSLDPKFAGSSVTKWSEDYEGLERPSDRSIVASEESQPFGPWVVNQLPLEQPGRWERRVCQIGPFFADVAIRKF